MKFTSAIHDKAYAVVAQYARGASDSIDPKTQYTNLCKVVKLTSIPPHPTHTHIMSHMLHGGSHFDILSSYS